MLKLVQIIWLVSLLLKGCTTSPNKNFTVCSVVAGNKLISLKVNRFLVAYSLKFGLEVTRAVMCCLICLLAVTSPQIRLWLTIVLVYKLYLLTFQFSMIL